MTTTLMTMSNEASHHCQIAVALNNLGITLLERQSYADAMLTLKDAVAVMKIAVRINERRATSSSRRRDAEEADEDEPKNGGTRIETAVHKLQEASKRLFLPKKPATCDSNDLLKLVRVVADSTLSETAHKALMAGPASEVAFPIRIDDLDIEGMLSRRLDQESAIVCYNLAVAYTMLCKKEQQQIKQAPGTATSSKRSRKLRRSALSLLAAAQSIAAVNGQLLDDDERSSRDAMHMAHLVSMEILCVHLMMNLFQEEVPAQIAGGAVGETMVELYSELTELRDVLYEMTDNERQRGGAAVTDAAGSGGCNKKSAAAA